MPHPHLPLDGLADDHVLHFTKQLDQGEQGGGCHGNTLHHLGGQQVVNLLQCGTEMESESVMSRLYMTPWSEIMLLCI